MNIKFTDREDIREKRFAHIWSNKLDEVFSDVAPYYDRANYVASLGMLDRCRDHFISTINLAPEQKVLDVCAGTNSIGIELLTREPSLQVYAVDKSNSMQKHGAKLARNRGFHIESIISDVHHLPFPDNSFDVVTLQWASRHLKLLDSFSEIIRVLKPGGHFYHSDMLRPRSQFVGECYYAYLNISLSFTALLFHSGPAARDCKDYFIKAIRMFYSSDEISELLSLIGFSNISSKILLGGMVGFHKACKT